MRALPSAAAIRAHLETHPKDGPAAVAAALVPDATDAERKTVINRAKNTIGRMRKKAKSRGTEPPPPARNPRRGRAIPRKRKQRAEPAAPAVAAQVTSLLAPPAVVPPAASLSLEPLPVPDPKTWSSEDMRIWHMKAAARVVSFSDTDAPNYTKGLAEFRMALKEHVEQERDEEGRRGPASAEELMRWLMDNLDKRELVPDHVLEMFIAEGLRRFNAKLVPAEAA